MKQETKIKIMEWFVRITNLFKKAKNYQFSNKKVIYVIGTPEYSNLGDHAIAVSQMEMLNRLFPEDEVVEMTNDMFLSDFLAMKRGMKKGDVITLIGGGNFGNEYPIEHKVRMTAINYFRNNRILIFPQTIYYSNDAAGVVCLKKDREVIQRHKDLHIMVREERSFSFAQENFKSAHIYFVPDTVLFLKRRFEDRKSGALICLRNDKESALEGDMRGTLKDAISRMNIPCSEIDTVLSHNVPKEDRVQVLTSMLIQFSKSELVVTDRLHGMIFAAITNTPCIVLPNYNHKVEGCYKTIAYLDYIRFMSAWDLTQFFECIRELKENNNALFYLKDEEKYEKIMHKIMDRI